MTSEQKEALRRLKESQNIMNPMHVIEYLCSKKALSLEERETIQISQTDQSKTLLNKLEEKKEWVYHCLLEGLEKSQQSYVVDILTGGNYKSVCVCVCFLFYIVFFLANNKMRLVSAITELE